MGGDTETAKRKGNVQNFYLKYMSKYTKIEKDMYMKSHEGKRKEEQ